MSHRKILGLLLVVATLLFFVGFVILYPGSVGLCNNQDCYHSIIFSVGQPLYLGMRFVTLTLVFLIFCSKAIFDIWKRFALVFLLVSLVWISSTPVTCGSIFCFNKEMVTWVTSIGFFIISFFIILYKTLKLRSKI